MVSIISFPDYIKHFIISGVVIVSIKGLLLFFRRKSMIKPSEKHAVFITGCDSGLGFSLALYGHKLGLTVIAGCLRLDGDGAKELQEKCPDKLHVIQLDITNTQSVFAAVQEVQNLLNKGNLELRALVNNAGVMIFGEVEWQTERHITHQINVNLLGTIRITKSVCPLLRKYSGRVINISSHCAQATLPTLSVYAATKAGLAAWSDGLRIEQAKYGVSVITFVPGSFSTQSNIMARQSEYAKEMKDEMSVEDFEYFGDYFTKFNNHLSNIPFPEKPVPLDDNGLYLKFKHALLANSPEPHYVHEPMRYAFYHFLFRISPTSLRDYFIERFTQLPKWQNRDS